MTDEEKEMQRALGTFLENASAEDIIHALGCFDYSHKLRLAGGRYDDPY